MSIDARITISALTLSAAAFVGILSREGYTDQAIIPVVGDVPTFGFGTTEGVKMGDRTTPVQAVKRALSDTSQFEGALKRCVTARLSQAEYDVYVDLGHNIGSHRFCYNDTGGPGAIPRRLNAGDYRGACDAILLYKYGPRKFDCSTPGNKVCAGVWKDRLKKHAQCMAAQ